MFLALFITLHFKCYTLSRSCHLDHSAASSLILNPTVRGPCRPQIYAFFISGRHYYSSFHDFINWFVENSACCCDYLLLNCKTYTKRCFFAPETETGRQQIFAPHCHISVFHELGKIQIYALTTCCKHFTVQHIHHSFYIM